MRYSWLLILAALPVLVALAVALDSRSRRGYGLGLLAASALVLDIWGFSAYFQVLRVMNASQMDNLDGAVVAAAYILSGLAIALALTLGAVVETLIARQWRWLAIITAVSFVPAAIIFAAAALVPDVVGALGLSGGGAAVVMLLPPVLVTFAYALARILRRPLAL